MKVVNFENNPIDCVSQLNASTFRQIVDQYTEVLLKKAYKLLLDEESAKDIVQDIFVELWEKRETIIITTNVTAYLFGMLKHRFLRQVSRNNIHNRAMDHLANRMQEMENGIIDAMNVSEMNETLGEILHTLPGNMQKIFILRDKDYSIKEIAEGMGLAEQTVKGYHSELKRRIKKGMLVRHPEISHTLLICIITNGVNLNNLFM